MNLRFKKPLLFIATLTLSTPAFSNVVELNCTFDKDKDKGGYFIIKWDKSSKTATTHFIPDPNDYDDPDEYQEKLKEANEISEIYLPTIEDDDQLTIRDETTKIGQRIPYKGKTVEYDLNVITDTIINRRNLELSISIKSFTRGIDGTDNWVKFDRLTNTAKLGECTTDESKSRKF